MNNNYYLNNYEACSLLEIIMQYIDCDTTILPGDGDPLPETHDPNHPPTNKPTSEPDPDD